MTHKEKERASEIFDHFEPLKGSINKTGFTKRLVHIIIRQMIYLDHRWSVFRDEHEVHTSTKYKALFKVIKNKLQYLRRALEKVYEESKVRDEMTRKAIQYDYMNNVLKTGDISIDDIVNLHKHMKKIKKPTEEDRGKWIWTSQCIYHAFKDFPDKA